MNRKSIFAAAVFCLAGWISAEPAKPEPFEDILREAVKEYRAGRVEKSREALDRAVKLLDERKSGKVVDSFPDAPEGWTVGDVEKSEIPAIMGGGRSIKKIYREKEGKKEITLEVIHDSPFGKLLMGLMVNDAVAEAQGFKVRSVGGDRALLKESADGGELNLPIDEKILVKLTSKGGALEKDMMALARYVDRRSLKKWSDWLAIQSAIVIELPGKGNQVLGTPNATSLIETFHRSPGVVNQWTMGCRNSLGVVRWVDAKRATLPMAPEFSP